MAKTYVDTIRMNCLTSMQVMIAESKTLGISFEMSETEAFAKKMTDIPEEKWSSDIGELIQNLWKDGGIRSAQKKKIRI